MELNTEVGAEDLMQLLKNYSRQQGTQMKAPKIDGEIWELVAGDVCFLVKRHTHIFKIVCIYPF